MLIVTLSDNNLSAKALSKWGKTTLFFQTNIFYLLFL